MIVHPQIGRHGLARFIESQFYRLRSAWRELLIMGLVSPALFLLVLGGGLGNLVDSGDANLGTDYLSFIGPGLLATSAMTWGTTQGLWPTLGELKWEGGYKAALVTPLTVDELAVGHILWISLRFFAASLLFCLVLVGFGVPDSWWFVLAPFAAAVTCSSFAALTVAFSSNVVNGDLFPLVQRFVIIPLSLFSGAFFPVSNLPTVMDWMARLTPSWHGVELCRALAQGTLSPLAGLGHVAYCLVLTCLGWLGARVGIRKMLSA